MEFKHLLKPDKTISTSTSLKKSLTLARVLKIPFTLEKPDSKNDGFVWNGKVFKFGHHTPSNIIHDVAHYLIAPKRDLNLPEFGLGRAMEAYTYAPTKVKNDIYTQEKMASILGILIEKELGLPGNKTLEDHGWSGIEDRDFKETINLLRKKKLIDETGIPVCLKKSSL